MTTFRTQLKLGERYRDKATGFEGTCTCITFYEHGCERATLKGMDRMGAVMEYGFDAPELETGGKAAKSIELIEPKTGGPHGTTPMRRR